MRARVSWRQFDAAALASRPTPFAARTRSPAAWASHKNHWLRSASAPFIPLLRPQTRRRATATVLRAARRRLRRAATAGCACQVCRRPNTVVNEWVRPADVELTRELTKKPRDPCAVVSANCCPKGARRDDRFEEKLGLEFSRTRVARATFRGSAEASRVGNDVGASLSGFGRLDPCWLYLTHLATRRRSAGRPTSATGPLRLDAVDPVLAHDRSVNARALPRRFMRRGNAKGVKIAL